MSSIFKRQWTFIALSNKKFLLLLHVYPTEYFQNFLYYFPHHQSRRNQCEDRLDIILLQHHGKSQKITDMLRYSSIFSDYTHYQHSILTTKFLSLAVNFLICCMLVSGRLGCLDILRTLLIFFHSSWTELPVTEISRPSFFIEPSESFKDICHGGLFGYLLSIGNIKFSLSSSICCSWPTSPYLPSTLLHAASFSYFWCESSSTIAFCSIL